MEQGSMNKREDHPYQASPQNYTTSVCTERSEAMANERARETSYEYMCARGQCMDGQRNEDIFTCENMNNQVKHV